jgi:hypothetical protein
MLRHCVPELKRPPLGAFWGLMAYQISRAVLRFTGARAMPAQVTNKNKANIEKRLLLISSYPSMCFRIDRERLGSAGGRKLATIAKPPYSPAPLQPKVLRGPCF